MNAGRLDRFPTFVKWLSLLMLIALSVGCARTLRFKVIDATSNRPVEGVEVQWFTSFIWLKIYKTNLVVAGYTDQDGVFAIDGVKKGNGRGNTFIFSRTNYQSASVLVHTVTNAVAIFSPDSASASETNRVFVSLEDRKAEITVPLHAR
jgi:hypothetical protein